MAGGGGVGVGGVARGMTTLRVSIPQHCTLHAIKYSECLSEASIHQPQKQFRCVQCLAL